MSNASKRRAVKRFQEEARLAALDTEILAWRAAKPVNKLRAFYAENDRMRAERAVVKPDAKEPLPPMATTTFRRANGSQSIRAAQRRPQRQAGFA